MITINNQHYKTTDLSEEAKAHLTHLRFVDAEIQRCQMSVNVFKISRQRIGEMLKKALPALVAVAPAVPVQNPAAVPATAPIAAKKPRAVKRKG